MAGIRIPTRDEIEKAASNQYLTLTDNEVDFMLEYIDEFEWVYRALDNLDSSVGNLRKSKRRFEYKPDSTEDPYHAFTTKCEIIGADTGSLDGYTVGIKDNIPIANIECTVGSSLLEGYHPTSDSPVVTRLLDAGATITGKTTLSPFAFSSEGVTWLRNPRDQSRVSGGSSSGSAVAVVTEDVDIALGTDQGGSIRNPAAWCGCVGLKPSHGLVPYSKAVSITDRIDHIGPMTKTVTDCAQVLEVIAGGHADDPRQRLWMASETNYLEGLKHGINGVSVGVLDEAFHDDVQSGVKRTVLNACDELEALGVQRKRVSNPWAEDGEIIWNVISQEGFSDKIGNEGVDCPVSGMFNREFARVFGQIRRTHGDDFELPMKAAIILGEFMADKYQKQYFYKAQNLARDLTESYEDILTDVDIIALPTENRIAPEMKEAKERSPLEHSLRYVREDESPNIRSQFNVTGHPAISIPCGTVDGLPVGLQLVSSHFEEELLLRVAHRLEQSLDFEF